MREEGGRRVERRGEEGRGGEGERGKEKKQARIEGDREWEKRELMGMLD